MSVQIHHAGGGIWSQVVNESGASFANFTSGSGTWSSDGTVIKQTDTAASSRKAKYNTMTAHSVIVFQSDIQIKTAGATRLGGLLVGYDGGTGTSGLLVRLDEGNNVVEIYTDNAALTLSVAQTIAIDTWYTLRLYVAGNSVSVFVDGTLIGSSRAGTAGSASFIGLFSYQAEVWFRNIKAWTLTLPA